MRTSESLWKGEKLWQYRAGQHNLGTSENSQEKSDKTSQSHQTFGERVRELRKTEGLSQKQLAVKSGLHYTYIAGVERGQRNPSLQSIRKIAQGLEVNIAGLFPSNSRRRILTEFDLLKKEMLHLLNKHKDVRLARLTLDILKDVVKTTARYEKTRD